MLLSSRRLVVVIAVASASWLFVGAALPVCWRCPSRRLMISSGHDYRQHQEEREEYEKKFRQQVTYRPNMQRGGGADGWSRLGREGLCGHPREQGGGLLFFSLCCVYFCVLVFVETRFTAVDRGVCHPPHSASPFSLRWGGAVLPCLVLGWVASCPVLMRCVEFCWVGL